MTPTEQARALYKTLHSQFLEFTDLAEQDIALFTVVLTAAHEAGRKAGLEARLPIDGVRFEQAPCYLCGYNNGGYYQPKTHPCAKRYHEWVAAFNAYKKGKP